MNRSAIIGIILIVIGVLGLSLLGPGFGPWSWGPRMMGPGMMGRGGWGMMGGPGGVPSKTTYTSNGERIFYTGASERTGPLPFQGGPMWLAMHGGGCVNCHGVSGRGRVPVMMGTAIPADIRYAALTAKDVHDQRSEEEAHPPYTDGLIKRAITQGVDPAGKSLDWTMPRWQMSEQDLNDLIAYLKTLRLFHETGGDADDAVGNDVGSRVGTGLRALWMAHDATVLDPYHCRGCLDHPVAGHGDGITGRGGGRHNAGHPEATLRQGGDYQGPV